MKQEEYDSEEELDLLKFEEKLKSEGRLAPSVETTTTCAAVEDPAGSGSDIDSDQDYDEFPLRFVDFKLVTCTFNMSRDIPSHAFKKLYENTCN